MQTKDSPQTIKKLLESFESKRDRTIVVVDYGNVKKWRESLKWEIGIRRN